MTAFRVVAATDARILGRSCESLLGVCSGLIADGELNDREIVFLRTWLAAHSELAGSWPGDVVLRRIESILSDGIVTSDERGHLLETLQHVVGGSFAETGAIPDGATELPLDHHAEITVAGRSFCFTGKFLYGTRSSCERAVLERDGAIRVAVRRDLCFLVVGELSSRDWKYSSFGTKIAESVALREAGAPLSIVSEARWARSL